MYRAGAGVKPAAFGIDMLFYVYIYVYYSDYMMSCRYFSILYT